MDKPIAVVVDEDPFFRKFCTDTLTREGLDVRVAPSGEDALRLCDAQPVALVVADIYMPKMSGIELLEEIKAHHPSTDVIVTTNFASVDTAIQALKKGASDYLRKPFAPEELVASVGNIIEQRKLYQVNEELRNRLRLYELSRSFTAAEEPSRVVSLGIDSLCEMTGTRVAVCAYINETEDALQLAELRGIERPGDDATEAKLIDRWRTSLLYHMESSLVLDADAVRDHFGPLVAQGYDKALVVVLRYGNSNKGFFALFRAPGTEPFHPGEVADAEFLGGQIAIGYKAAVRFQEAKGLAYIDSLTDLYNSRYLPVVLEKRMKDASQSGKPLSLLFLDLDHFRDINTLHGHQAGGKALIEVAWILESNVRTGDTVIRYGGDEFTVVLPDADTRAAQEIAERIRKAISNHNFLGEAEKKVHVTACIGVATYPQDAQTPELLIHLADKAMYKGKDSTRDTVIAASVGKST